MKKNQKPKNKKFSGLKIALVHDYLAGYGGAERVLEAFHQLFPRAPIYTSFFLPGNFGPHQTKVKEWPIRTSFLQKVPFKKFLISPFRLLAPTALRKLNLSGFDLIIVSATGAYTPNTIKTASKAIHLCYCHTPPRYLYGYPTARNWQKHWWGRSAGNFINHFLRLTDFESAQKVSHFIANSREVAGRIKKFYRRDSVVIYPPVDIQRFKNRKQGGEKEGVYYLAGGRLARAKRIDLAVRACNRLNLPLKVFGSSFAGYGEELKKLAGPTVEFVDEVNDRELADLYANCRAYIFCADQEDFGITPVEAMAAGRPVIAYRSGGVRETVVEGKTGLFFEELTVNSLIKVLKKFDISIYRKIKFRDCWQQAEKYSQERFKREILEFVSEVVSIGES
ncbi:MAG: glycosyltransferase [Candidatus Pacebacteria bacterium]|nr:glycosyltransferase [Candidatus Paceibacterota bacterium]